MLLLKKPGRMKWTYSQPQGKLFVLDGHNAYFIRPDKPRCNECPPKKLDDLRSPLRFLLGHTELAKELTDLTLTPQGANYDLSGVPRNMQQRVQFASLQCLRRMARFSPSEWKKSMAQSRRYIYGRGSQSTRQ